jgi:hypothetical protein
MAGLDEASKTAIKKMKEIVLAKERGELTEKQALEAIFKIVENDTASKVLK